MTFGFNSLTLESMLSGSNTAFKTRERPTLSEQEYKSKLKYQRNLEKGIYLLRKLKGRALEENDDIIRQNVLKEAHQLSTQMAEEIIDKASKNKPSQIDSSLLQTMSEMEIKYTNQEDKSGHYLPAQFSITNLLRAADDMLVRIEEKAQSIYTPDHRLTQEEMNYVLKEFLRGTNDLTVNVKGKFFDKNTRLGGILSGGSVYTEMAKNIIEKYADPSLEVYSFVVAVDKENKKSAFETSESDNTTQTVVLLDDVIDGGGTILTALKTVGEYFPNATIHSGKGIDYAGGFEKRRIEKHRYYLCGLFQDFADLSEDGLNDESLAIFQQAEEYAQRNKVPLEPGWYLRKERLETV